uniref:Uncharacterized protein n=1 Tax=Plectus sambesii TaxID=2011161 RepID=A0A914UNX9_9BILA
MRSGGLCDCAHGSHQQSTANVPAMSSQSAYDADYAAARPPSPKRPRPSAVSPIDALGAKHVADLMANAAHLTCRSTEWRVGARYAFHVQSAPTPPILITTLKLVEQEAAWQACGQLHVAGSRFTAF